MHGYFIFGYLLKPLDMATCSVEEIYLFVKKRNLRSRKCLQWKSPYEVFFSLLLRLT